VRPAPSKLAPPLPRTPRALDVPLKTSDRSRSQIPNQGARYRTPQALRLHRSTCLRFLVCACTRSHAGDNHPLSWIRPRGPNPQPAQPRQPHTSPSLNLGQNCHRGSSSGNSPAVSLAAEFPCASGILTGINRRLWPWPHMSQTRRAISPGRPWLNICVPLPCSA
jgi:hypothetical protein